MSTTDYPPQGGTCDRCGMRTVVNAEGHTVCEGCGKSTEHCQCGAK